MTLGILILQTIGRTFMHNQARTEDMKLVTHSMLPGYHNMSVGCRSFE